MTFEAWSLIPFVIMLGAIAVFPLWPAMNKLWERRTFQLAFALILGIPVAVWLWIGGEQMFVIEKLWEYVQFIVLLLSLFVVSGGIFLAGDIRATPKNNTIFLACGTLLASFIGTTGAAMLFIRPVLNTNKERTHRAHTVLFLIFGVANCGGLLTPLGDPPLFLGFLSGVPFAWTFSLWKEWLFVNVLLLATYYALDRKLYASEPKFALELDESQRTPLAIRGALNFLWLAMIVIAVAFVPSLNLEGILHGEVTFAEMIPWREIVMICALVASYIFTKKEIRFGDNEFEWGPILEVASLFIGIFTTMMPALKFLAQVAPSLPLNRVTFFAFSGSLSSVLDNAPTYLTFFEMARTLTLDGAESVAGVPVPYLIAISCGSVFCGAITYIGNGPNFMVKSVADSNGVQMPAFGMYIVRSCEYLAPILIAMAGIFIAANTIGYIIGAAVLVFVACRIGYYLYAEQRIRSAKETATHN